MDSIVALISNVGFPIAMCLLIMHYWNGQYTRTIEELKTTVSRLTDVVNSNTTVLTALVNEIEGDNHK